MLICYQLNSEIEVGPRPALNNVTQTLGQELLDLLSSAHLTDLLTLPSHSVASTLITPSLLARLNEMVLEHGIQIPESQGDVWDLLHYRKVRGQGRWSVHSKSVQGLTLGSLRATKSQTPPWAQHTGVRGPTGPAKIWVAVGLS
jgi:hypothetical protein